jgi:hypothetical protein
VDVAGHSGYAFLTNVAENVDASGPTAFDWGLLLPGIRNLGRSTLMLMGGHCKCEAGESEAKKRASQQELRAAYDLIASEVGAGRPCVVWGTYLPEFGIAVGVDGDNIIVESVRRVMRQPQPPIRFDELSTPGGAYVLGFPSAIAVDREQADRNAVYNALDMLNLRHSNPGYANGQAAYDRWIAAMESGKADPFGNSYNTQCWTDAKRMAREFLRRLAGRNPVVQKQLGDAVAAYGGVVEAMEKVAGLFPFRDAEKKVEDPKVRAQAMEPLRAAKAAEAKAAEALSQTVATWPKRDLTKEVATLAPCGIDCGKCDILTRGDCSGCRGDRRHQWSGDCGMRQCCVDDKHLAFCSQCGGFPCGALTDWAAQYPHHGAALERLKEMRKAANA